MAGEDAIQFSTEILAALKHLENAFNDRSADALFAQYPFARPITVDTVQGGQWQGMVCDRCKIAGYFELLPDDDTAQWQDRFESQLRHLAGDKIRFDMQFPETYAGHRMDSCDPLCQAARIVHWQGFNSGCEAGLRSRLQGTPTLVWGPGSLAQAHAADEYVDFADVHRCAEQMAAVANRWCEGVPSNGV